MTVSVAGKRQEVLALHIRLELDLHRQVLLGLAELSAQEWVCDALAKIVRPAFTEQKTS